MPSLKKMVIVNKNHILSGKSDKKFKQKYNQKLHRHWLYTQLNKEENVRIRNKRNSKSN